MAPTPSAAAAAAAEVAEVGDRLAAVARRIAAAATRAGRVPEAVSVVAVSKGFAADMAVAARDAGQIDLGENRVQELLSKARQVSGVRWHFIGRLQRNKVRDVVGLAELIHSVDRVELAEEIATRAARASCIQRVLVQVNAGEDPAKAGVRVEAAEELVHRVRDMQGLACEGLMTMPAAGVDPRPAFARLRQLRDDLRTRFPEVQHLSMGMTNDFEVAVEEGATIVRIGEAVFGPRPNPQNRPMVAPVGRA